MDLAEASSFFDDDPVRDAYSGALLFYGHTSAHDDHTSSGATARRRTLAAAPEAAAPARGVVDLYGEVWLVSNSNLDSFDGVPIRRSFGLKKSTGLMTALTPAQACLGQAGTDFHAHKEYFRDNQDARTGSDWDVMWNIFCPPSEPVAKGTFLRQGGTLFRVRNAYTTVEELVIAEADQFDADALQSAVFTSAVLDLVTDRRGTTTTSAQVVQTDLQKYYAFRTQAEGNAQAGDRAVFVAKSALMPAVGIEFTLQGAKWRTLAVVSEQDAWMLHARQV
jgi:hypothetical protein